MANVHNDVIPFISGEEVQEVKRTYKDSLFRKIFGEKEKLLSLYNAINGTAYTNADDLKINTLDNAVYLNMKNDISFILGFHLNLYEHQSTACGNMPLRNLIYITKLYQKEIGAQSLYSSAVIRLPAPQFVVFYNGMEQRPERWTETLSSAFEKPVDNPKLELEVLFLNVNYGKNQNLMEQCRTLEEYALYVAKVRKYAAVMPIRKAVECAVTESIKENILADFLSRYRAEAIQMSILEYDEERELKLIRKAEYEVGKHEGISEGKLEALVAIIRKKLKKEVDEELIAAFLEIEPDLVRQVKAALSRHPEADDAQIAGQLKV